MSMRKKEQEKKRRKKKNGLGILPIWTFVRKRMSPLYYHKSRPTLATAMEMGTGNKRTILWLTGLTMGIWAI